MADCGADTLILRGLKVVLHATGIWVRARKGVLKRCEGCESKSTARGFVVKAHAISHAFALQVKGIGCDLNRHFKRIESNHEQEDAR